MFHSGINYTLLVFVLVISTALNLPAQEYSLTGAWELIESGGEKPAMKVIQIMSHDYFMYTKYDIPTQKFDGSLGGNYAFDDKNALVTFDFHTWDSLLVGQSFGFKVKFTDANTMSWRGVINGDKIREVWKRVDEGKAPLAGAWKIGRRLGRGNEMREMQEGPRKTIKILSGTHFQWTAMNTETKEFMGCGGGTYTFKDGEYTENIEFFSRNPDRVGAKLSFQGSVEGNEWLHQGKSSRSMPIKEFWVRQ